MTGDTRRERQENQWTSICSVEDVAPSLLQTTHPRTLTAGRQAESNHRPTLMIRHPSIYGQIGRRDAETLRRSRSKKRKVRRRGERDERKMRGGESTRKGKERRKKKKRRGGTVCSLEAHGTVLVKSLIID
ncbi:unnamed protein product [Pleuronectes platessa]|uniref:Uncharacterized protein n=1 Tax=Pleuronectes platessa TaxID=8262 RepID=A0A9N7YAL3_PLEPL|nr:unnamed protein product [Pleuronectes platessa]